MISACFFNYLSGIGYPIGSRWHGGRRFDSITEQISSQRLAGCVAGRSVSYLGLYLERVVLWNRVVWNRVRTYVAAGGFRNLYLVLVFVMMMIMMMMVLGPIAWIAWKDVPLLLIGRRC